MEIRKSGKLAIGIIAAMGTIGALHWFVFKERAFEYNRDRAEFDRVLADYNSQGNPPEVNQINAFHYQTLRYKLRFWETIAGLDLTIPNEHMPDAAGQVNVALQQGKLWDVLRSIQQWEKEGNEGQKPKLSFLAQRGWNFTTTLPQELSANQIATEDLLTTLANEDRLLLSLDPKSQVHAARTATYNGLLARLGLNINERQFLQDRYGPLFGTLFTLNRIDNVMKDLPEDYFRNSRLNEQQALEQMYTLFRITWPKDFLDTTNYYLSQRQGEALVSLFGIAREEGIDDVVRVKFFDFRPIYWEEPKTAEELDATPTSGGMGGFNSDMDEEGMMMMMMDAEGGGGMEGGFGGFGGGFGFGGMMARATPTPATGFDAVGAPIEIWVQGSNSAVMGFLYHVANSDHPFELDKLRLFTRPDANQESSSVVAVAFINVVGYSQAVGVMTDTDLQKKLVEAKREMYELAERPGAGPLAVADGIAAQGEGNRPFKLVVEMPTPWPEDPNKKAAAPPAAPPPGMDGEPMMEPGF